jgi:dihydrofolate synthase/folylpolyglutamate synthase
MNFSESLNYLYNPGNEVLAMKLGLENITTLLRALGNPQEKFMKVQVAGTNGKGSTCAFIESICLQAGIRTGLNTSPHLVSITERIRINGVEISQEQFARYASLIKDVSIDLLRKGELEALPTFFEQVTAIAIKAFADAEIELAVLETGLGGRFDAVTAAKADIVVFTQIDLDHQRILGDTIEKIAEEKAAIIRPDTLVISSQQKPEAMNVILRKCKQYNLVPHLASNVLVTEIDGRFQFKTTKSEYRNVQLGLLGRHQLENAKTAVLAAEQLQKYFVISAEAIVNGLRSVKHKGRLEFDGKFLFDGSHNIAGARALREFLDESVDKPIVMLFSVMKDKDVEEIAEILFPRASRLVLTEVSERSMPIERLHRIALKYLTSDRVFAVNNVDEALNKALEIAGVDDLILVTGSLYLIGEVQKRRNSYAARSHSNT